jgi:8-amino-7-oxononanoate synthase/acyl carrier protein
MAMTTEVNLESNCEAVAAGKGEQTAAAVIDVVLDEVRRAVPSGFNCSVSLDTSLDELGLDSLARMNILNALEEKFGIRFTEESFFDIETCRDVLDYIEANASFGDGAKPRPEPEPSNAPPATAAPRQISAEHYDVTRLPECIAFAQRVAVSMAAGLENPFFRVKEAVCGATATVAGREVTSYTSFDYVGLARDSRVAAAAKQALDRYGTSASASRLVGGNLTVHEQLDTELARFLGTEAAAAFPSGFGTNESVLGHLFGPEDLILCDELAHTSIVQGAILSKAHRRPFPHNDAQFVDNLLADVRGNYRRVAIAIEGAYSMDGDYPNLAEFVEVKRRRQAMLYVDEAHSLGVLGKTGRGICEQYGVDPGDGDVWMGTISKALGSGGGYIAGRKTLVDYLKYTTPCFVFATAMSPANAAAALKAIEILREEPERVGRLHARSQLFLNLVREAGLDTGGSKDTAVVPIIVGDSRLCLEVSARLLREGIDAQPILYPAVPESKSRVRFFITADHSEEQIRQTVRALAAALGAKQVVQAPRA